VTPEPLRITFDVACAVDRAFAVWTQEIGTWWPADHTVTGGPDLTIVLEPRVGGRVYERTADGTEHDWGRVTGWDPPHRLAYRWHLRQDPADATDVEIRFTAQGDRSTRIEIVHRGWDRLAAAGETARQRNRTGWETLLPHYRAAADEGGS